MIKIQERENLNLPKYSKQEIEAMAEVQELVNANSKKVFKVVEKCFKNQKINNYQYYIFNTRHGFVTDGEKASFSKIKSTLVGFSMEQVLEMYNSALKVIANEISALNHVKFELTL